MKLYFYRGSEPNFGDELNTWLLPKIFPGFFDDDARQLFLGIGSVIFDSHPTDALKVVFGSGYGAYTPLPRIDANWKFYGVRGPRTAEACGLPAESVVGDSAILIHRFRTQQPRKIIRCAFIPHWESIARGNWQAACALAGIHFLDPRQPVDEVIAQIEASEMVIAEAMHGAIVADALRVPWVAIEPFHSSHLFKWHDWAGALDLPLRQHRVFPSSVREARLSLPQGQRGLLRRAVASPRLPVALTDRACLGMAAASLWRASRQEPTLSADAAMSRAVERLENAAERIRSDFAKAA